MGHLHEMMDGRLSCRIDGSAVPVFPEALDYADEFLLTAAGQRNRNHVQEHVKFVNVPFAMEEVLYDPQTSGGLLVSVSVNRQRRYSRNCRKQVCPRQLSVKCLKKRDRDYCDDVGVSCNNRS